MLDWCQNLNGQSDITKTEFCLIAAFRNPDHGAVKNLTFESNVHGVIASRLLPELYVYEWDGSLSGYLEDEYVKAYSQGELPTFNWSSEPVVLAHQLLFASDFSVSPITDQVLVDTLQAATPDTEEHEAIIKIGLHCLGQDVGDMTDLNQYFTDNYPPTWDYESYHPLAVIDFLKATQE